MEDGFDDDLMLVEEGCFKNRCPKCDTFHDMDMLFNDVKTLFSNAENSVRFFVCLLYS